MTRAAEVLDALRARGWHVATAESCTGGMIAAALTDIAGASDVVERGFVTYSNSAKIDLLGVAPDTLAAHGAVSEAVAAEMVRGALARAPVQIAVAVTGIAGPGGSETKPEGRVCFGLGLAGGVSGGVSGGLKAGLAKAAPLPAITTETVEFGARGRAAVRQAAVAHALELLARAATHQLP